ncbi:hypothetical protein [Candidatus Cyrtobacter comes]|nr:hypothetical protein [Candidatus Cyrtobacter comes]
MQLKLKKHDENDIAPQGLQSASENSNVDPLKALVKAHFQAFLFSDI